MSVLEIEFGAMSYLKIIYIDACRVVSPRSICLRMSEPVAVAITNFMCKSCSKRERLRLILVDCSLLSRLLVVSNSEMGGQRTLAIVLLGVLKKQLQPSNCPTQYVPERITSKCRKSFISSFHMKLGTRGSSWRNLTKVIELHPTRQFYQLQMSRGSRRTVSRKSNNKSQKVFAQCRKHYSPGSYCVVWLFKMALHSRRRSSNKSALGSTVAAKDGADVDVVDILSWRHLWSRLQTSKKKFCLKET